MMLTTSGDDSIGNNFLSGSTDLVNIQKEESVLKYDATFSLFHKHSLKICYYYLSVALK